MTAPPLSVRLNNPGNLERSASQWLGLVPLEQLTEDAKEHIRYCAFVAPVWGFRALAEDLHTKWSVHRLRSIAAIIAVYAPPPENKTKAYIDAVAQMMDVAPDAALNLDDFQQLSSFARAVSVHEAGGWFFQTADLNRGVMMALSPYPRPADPNAAATAQKASV